jgi:hypothetical protein
MRGNHRHRAVGGHAAGAEGQRLGGTRTGAECLGLPNGIGPGHIPGILRFGP